MKLSRRDKWETAGMVLWLVFLSVMAAVGIVANAPAITLVCALFLGINGYQLWASLTLHKRVKVAQ